MKRFTFMLALFAFATSFAQQYTPFITPGKQISMTWDCSPCQSMFASSHYYFNGDTTVNNVVYQKLFAKTLTNSSTYFHGQKTEYLAAILREDTVAQKVYKYAGLPQDISDTAHFNSEIVLYDFSVQVGDSVTAYVQNPDGMMTFEISQIDTVILNNSISVRTHYSSNSLTSAPLYSEAIINSIIPFDLSIPAFRPVYSCVYGENGIFLYNSQGSCSANNYIGTEEFSASPYISIYPNPATELIVLNTPISGEFELYDILGNLVLKSSILADEQKTLALPKVAAGLYVWVFSTKKGVEKGKLMVEK